MFWNYRYFEHRNPNDPEHEVSLTVHEVYYDEDGTANAFCVTPASPISKKDVEHIAKAFDKPAVGWVDDGVEDWKKWGWL